MKNKESVQQTTKNDREKFPHVLDKLYELIGENTPISGLNYRDAARQHIGIADTMLSRLIIDMERAGTFSRSYKTRPHLGTVHGSGGKISTWILPLPKAEALARQKAFWDANPVGTVYGRKSSSITRVPVKPVVVNDVSVTIGMDKHGEMHEAIVGPEARSPFEALRSERKDESSALVEAARQYVDRRNVIRRAFAEMEKQGITVDWSQMDKVVSVETDDRLESVAALLPYITTLEKRIERLLQDTLELRGRVKGMDALNQENRALREQNQRLLADKVGRSQAAAHV